MTGRERRRFFGYARARLPDAQFARVGDPRRQGSIRHRLPQLLTACVVALFTGATRLSAVEELSEDISPAARRSLGLVRRIPDTTLRDTLVRLEPTELVACLHRVVRAADRRKALRIDGLPFGAVSLDGKATAIAAWDDAYAQKQPHSSGHGASGVVRTITSCLISSAARPCIDAFPVPPDTNEMGVYARALDHLQEAYSGRDLFRVVLYDAGACSESNARYTRSKGLHYVFCLNGQQPTLHEEAQRVMGSVALESAEHVDDGPRGSGTWCRSVFISEEMAGWHGWKHLRTVVRVVSERFDAEGQPISVEERYYVSSLPKSRLSPKQWNTLIRRRWAVENECHHALDTVFSEDEHPWITSDPRGTVVVMMLRRLAHTLLALFRSVTLRSDTNRSMPWRRILRMFELSLLAITQEEAAGLRPRRPGEPSPA